MRETNERKRKVPEKGSRVTPGGRAILEKEMADRAGKNLDYKAYIRHAFATD